MFFLFADLLEEKKKAGNLVSYQCFLPQSEIFELACYSHINKHDFLKD